MRSMLLVIEGIPRKKEMIKFSSTCSLVSMLVATVSTVLVGCADPTKAQPDSTSTVSQQSNPWYCEERESAFGEIRAACAIVGDYIEGASVIMNFSMFCAPEPGQSENLIVSRFRGKDFAGNLVSWSKYAEASIDGGQKEELLLRPTAEAFLLDHDQYGIDPLAPSNTLDTVHARILPKTESMLFRGTIEPERVTTTSLFEWGDWQVPIDYLAERGCVWR